ncbi:hypothetical protein K6Q96_12490 [Grimontia kaedaensis]|uniref:Lipoprotein n=1 Tax=Grimontia kaedaensis TaxID=2872157 RepID=A0ABY4WUV7_9GAMM|nr:hypothetical protein [Grimontia kaedaensis]USH01695.1 hypothetical protein K6Q96_12490 [Grimontia kaedaensis]
MKKILFASAAVSLVGCGGDESSGQQTVQIPSIPQMSVAPASGSVANTEPSPISYIGLKATSSNTGFFKADNRGDCQAYMHLDNITNGGWVDESEDQYRAHLPQYLLNTYKDFPGVASARVAGKVETSNVAAKDWIANFYYASNFYDCDTRNHAHFDSVETDSNGIVNLRDAWSVVQQKDGRLDRTTYVGWLKDKNSNETTGMSHSFSQDDAGKYNHKLRSLATGDSKTVDLIRDFTFGNQSYESLIKTYFANIRNGSGAWYQIVGGTRVGEYKLSAASSTKAYFAVNMVSAFFEGIGTKVSWCTVGAKGQSPLTPQTFNDLRTSGDLEQAGAYCDPLDDTNNESRYYDAAGKTVSDQTTIGLLDANTDTIKSQLEQFTDNSTLYNSYSQEEYFKSQELSHEINKLQADLRLR